MSLGTFRNASSRRAEQRLRRQRRRDSLGNIATATITVSAGVTPATLDPHHEAGASELARLLAPQGYATTLIPVRQGLHLKSFVNTLGGDRLIVSRELGRRPRSPHVTRCRSAQRPGTRLR